MKHEVDAELLADIERVQLRFVCEQCVYHVPETGICSEGYPNAEHRARRLHVGDSLSFCKLFEVM